MTAERRRRYNVRMCTDKTDEPKLWKVTEAILIVYGILFLIDRVVKIFVQ